MKTAHPLHVSAQHIAIIMHDFSTGGTERIAIRLANIWARSGRQVSILCGVTTGPARKRLDPRVAVIGMWPEIPRGPLSRIVLARALAGCIDVIEPDLIFAPGNFHIPVIAIVARLLGDRRPAIVCKLSNPLVRPDRPRWLQFLFEKVTRHFLAHVDGLVAMSASLAAEARSVLDRADVQLIYEPNIDADHWQPSDSSKRDGRTILCAGRLVHQKNFELAIKALAQVSPDYRARLVILGDGVERRRLKTLVDRLGLNERVEFAGHVDDIRPALARANLFLLCSRYEGYPAVLIEALSAGVPVLTTPCSPAVDEILIEPSFGRKVDFDPAAMARAIEVMLRRPWEAVDPDALVERHRADAVADRYLALFDTMVRQHITSRLPN